MRRAAAATLCKMAIWNRMKWTWTWPQIAGALFALMVTALATNSVHAAGPAKSGGLLRI
jgi:hypothetical protein